MLFSYALLTVINDRLNDSSDQLTSDGDLIGVGVVEEERAWLTRARREVESQAKRMLLQGLELLVR